jgi:site-specific DNA-cytosine methylase
MRYKALGAHIYAGGFTVGVSKHFDVVGHLEHAAYGKEVVELNFSGLPVISGGPAAWKPFVDALPRGRDRVRFVYANPPCAVWSVIGRDLGKNDWRNDPRLTYHHDIFNLLKSVEPDVLAIESVPPIFTKGRPHIDALTAQADALGYSTTVVQCDAQNHGVAQARGRVFAAFHRVAIDWQPPVFERTTVRDALRALPRRKTRGYATGLPERLRDLVSHAKPGDCLRHVFDELHPNASPGDNGKISGRPRFVTRRFPWDAPAPVVLAGEPVHPSEDRFMSREELAAVCSFPPEFLWPDANFVTTSGWMSRGVMPKVGEWLAENVARAIDTGRRVNRPTAEVYDVRAAPGQLYDLQPLAEETTTVQVKLAGPRPDKTPPWDVAPKKGTLVTKANAAPPPPDAGEGSGAYIRRLLRAGRGDEEVLAAVHAGFPASKATKSDLSWNRGRIRKEDAAGGAAPVARPAAQRAPESKKTASAPASVASPPAVKLARPRDTPETHGSAGDRALRARLEPLVRQAAEIQRKIMDVLAGAV